jgi:hypothetical protein
MREGIPSVTDGEFADFLAAERAVLVLTLSTCGACAAYEAELLDRRQDGELVGVTLAKLVLDRPGATRFKRDNTWLAELEFLPHTVLYVQGTPVEEFATSHAGYLVERLAALERGHRPRVGLTDDES